MRTGWLLPISPIGWTSLRQHACSRVNTCAHGVLSTRVDVLNHMEYHANMERKHLN